MKCLVLNCTSEEIINPEISPDIMLKTANTDNVLDLNLLGGLDFIGNTNLNSGNPIDKCILHCSTANHNHCIEFNCNETSTICPISHLCFKHCCCEINYSHCSIKYCGNLASNCSSTNTKCENHCDSTGHSHCSTMHCGNALNKSKLCNKNFKCRVCCGTLNHGHCIVKYCDLNASDCNFSSKCEKHCGEKEHIHCSIKYCDNKSKDCNVFSKCVKHCGEKDHNHCSHLTCSVDFGDDELTHCMQHFVLMSVSSWGKSKK